MGDGGGNGSLPKAVLGWPAIILLLIADVVGGGVLSLGASLTTLGWVPGILGILIFFFLSLLSGMVIGDTNWRYTKAMSYGELCGAVVSPRFGQYVDGVCYTGLMFALASYIIALTDSLIGATSDTVEGWCTTVAGLVSVAMVVVPIQLRTMHNLVATSVWGLLTILVVIMIPVIWVATEGANPEGFPGYNLTDERFTNVSQREISDTLRQDTVAVEYGSDTFEVVGAINVYASAFSGNMIFVQIMAEMRQPRDFNRGLVLGLFSILALYLFTMSMYYAFTGPNYFISFFIDTVAGGPARKVADSFMIMHIITTYLLTSQVLTRRLLQLLKPRMLVHDAPPLPAALAWFIASVTITFLAYVLAMCIPLFDDAISFVGALIVNQVTLVIPAVIFYHEVKRRTRANRQLLLAAQEEKKGVEGGKNIVMANNNSSYDGVGDVAASSVADGGKFINLGTFSRTESYMSAVSSFSEVDLDSLKKTASSSSSRKNGETAPSVTAAAAAAVTRNDIAVAEAAIISAKLDESEHGHNHVVLLSEPLEMWQPPFGLSERTLCRLCMLAFLVGLVMMVLGTVSAIVVISKNTDFVGLPFTCEHNTTDLMPV